MAGRADQGREDGRGRTPPPRRGRPVGGTGAAVPGRAGDPARREAASTRSASTTLIKTMNLPVWQAETLADRHKPPDDLPTARRRVRPGGRPDRPDADTAGPADRPAATRRGPAPLRRRARRHTAREACPTSRCRCPTTRSPASRSATRSPATRPTCAALRPPAEAKNPSFNLHYEVTLRK